MGCASSSAADPSGAPPGREPVPPLNTSPASPTEPDKPQLSRGLTTRSLATVETLDSMAAELEQMQTLSDTAAAALADAQTPLPVGLRGELASLHGTANRLLSQRLDAIVTADLTTGRDEARAKRKALVAAAEALIELTEAQIKSIDQRKGGVDAQVEPPLALHEGAAAAPASL